MPASSVNQFLGKTSSIDSWRMRIVIYENNPHSTVSSENELPCYLKKNQTHSSWNECTDTEGRSARHKLLDHFNVSRTLQLRKMPITGHCSYNHKCKRIGWCRMILHNYTSVVHYFYNITNLIF